MIKYHFIIIILARFIKYFFTKQSANRHFLRITSAYKLTSSLPQNSYKKLIRYKSKQFVQDYVIYFNERAQVNIILISNNEAYDVKKVSFTRIRIKYVIFINSIY